MPEERRAEGLVLSKSVAFNVSLANLKRIVVSPALPLISNTARTNLTLETIRALSIKTESADTPVGRLSGIQRRLVDRFCGDCRQLTLDRTRDQMVARAWIRRSHPYDHRAHHTGANSWGTDNEPESAGDPTGARVFYRRT